MGKVYSQATDQQAPLRAKQWRYVEETSPRCTVVTGPIDLDTGGEGGKDPDDAKRLIPINDRVLSIHDKE
jgi:hypothetical protein